MRANLNLTVFALATALFISCKTEKEEFTSEALADYVPLQVGKYITYRLDSTVFTNLNRTAELHSYQEKHVIDAQYPDGMGRPSYRILRFIRDVDGTKPWAPAGTYFITPTEKTLEVIEDNLRFVKLALPVKQNFSWKGNQYLPDEPFSSYQFNNDNQINLWDYRIDSVNTSMSFNGSPLSNIIKVVGIDENEVPDTIEVTGEQVQIPASMNTVYLRGIVSDTIKINTTPSEGKKLTVYNRTNWAMHLDGIFVPVDGGKSFEYLGNKWVFGFVNGVGVRKDSLYTELPFASRDVLIDKYAKGIGLVYQEFILWEFQPVSNTSNDGTTQGFGVKRVMIDHN